LFAGDKNSISRLLKFIINSPSTSNDTTTIEEASVGAPENLIRIDPIPRAFADYTNAVVNDRYPNLTLSELPNLVNAHLHERFLAQYNNSINIPSPPFAELDMVHYQAAQIAHRLSFCPPKNPIPESCPSNRACTPCKRVPVTNKPFISTDTNTFMIAAIPHPYTYTALMNPKLSLASDSSNPIRFVRGQTRDRDAWLRKVTSPPLKATVGPSTRVLKIKQLIAAPPANYTSLWSAAESGYPEEELQWTLGFTIPSAEEVKVEVPTPKEEQKLLFEKTVKEVKTADKTGEKVVRIRKAVEAWNLGSTEIWRFAAAFVERGVFERRKWSEQEREYGKGLSEEEKKARK
jgi:hypothetical protein